MNLITLNPPLYFIALFLRFIPSLSHADRFEPFFCRRAMPTNRSLSCSFLLCLISLPSPRISYNRSCFAISIWLWIELLLAEECSPKAPRIARGGLLEKDCSRRIARRESVRARLCRACPISVYPQTLWATFVSSGSSLNTLENTHFWRTSLLIETSWTREPGRRLSAENSLVVSSERLSNWSTPFSNKLESRN